MNIIDEFKTIDGNKLLNTSSRGCGCIFLNYENFYSLEKSCNKEISIRKNHSLHRLEGPATITSYAKSWYYHNKRHRVKGPAIEYFSGRKNFFKMNLRHRFNAPAIIDNYITKYFEYGVEILKNEFNTRIP